MKQREARGAASPRREQEQEEEDRRSGEWERMERGEGEERREISSRALKQILFGIRQRAVNGERAKTRVTFMLVEMILNYFVRKIILK